jgi:hypothetical protein
MCQLTELHLKKLYFSWSERAVTDFDLNMRWMIRTVSKERVRMRRVHIGKVILVVMLSDRFSLQINPIDSIALEILDVFIFGCI